MRYVKVTLVLVMAVVAAIAFAQPARADISFDLAYSDLSAHGTWLVSAQYGHVWQPREYNRQWNPYSDGHWVYTDMGWVWVSDYAWGAIPYHYGTWIVDSEDGWVWIPGNTWGPSWVVFRTTPEYIGWAPVPPGYSVGASIDMEGPRGFVFVSSRDFLAPRLRTSIISQERANAFMNSTTVVNNIVIQNNVVTNRGPDYRTVERATGRTLREERIESVARVAPYPHVSRAQLAVAPERVKQGVRVAEPVPASQPLPVAGQHGRPNAQEQGRTPAAAPARGQAPGARIDKTNAPQRTTIQPQDAKPRPDVRTQQQHAKPRPDVSTQQQHARPQPDVSTQQRHAKPQPDVSTQQQRAKPQADARQQPHAQAPPSARTAQQHARPLPDANAQQQHARPQPDARAKKAQPEKKDPGGDKGGSEKPKQGPDK